MKTKVCTECGIEKPISEFAKKKTGKYGVKGYCKVCHRAKYKKYYEENREDIRERAEKYRDENREKVRAQVRNYSKKYREEKREWIKIRDKKQNVKRFFGISVEEYDELMSVKKCEICGTTEDTRYTLDHCHNTKKIRGCLCSKCNLMLGHANDNQQTLLNAIEYLKKYSD